MLPELTRRLLADWPRLGCPGAAPSGIEYMGIPGSVEGGTTTFLGFAPGARQPLFAVKVHRDLDARERVGQESAVLRLLAGAGEAVAGAVPTLLLGELVGGTWVLVQSIVPGRPMDCPLNSEGQPDGHAARANFQAVAAWLVELHRRTALSQPATDEQVLQRQAARAEEFCECFELSQAERDFIRHCVSHLHMLAPFPISARHGDFCRQNILLTDQAGTGRLGVIDWTDSSLSALPLHDLFFFLSTYFLQVRSAPGVVGFLAAFRYSFLTAGDYGDLVWDTVRDYLAATALTEELVEPLFTLFLAEQAMFEYRKLQRAVKYGSLPRFTMFLADQQGLSYPDALRAQVWIHFFRTVARQPGQLRARVAAGRPQPNEPVKTEAAADV